MRDHRRHRFRRNTRRTDDESVAPDATVLTDVPRGRVALVTGYRGGEGLRRKAMELGLVPGAGVEVLLRSGALVVRVGDTRMMIGRGVARHVQVVIRE
jgi:Fe2+ transport system protein FeoA